jgi:hypothetical protein
MLALRRLLRICFLAAVGKHIEDSAHSQNMAPGCNGRVYLRPGPSHILLLMLWLQAAERPFSSTKQGCTRFCHFPAKRNFPLHPCFTERSSLTSKSGFAHRHEHASYSGIVLMRVGLTYLAAVLLCECLSV